MVVKQSKHRYRWPLNSQKITADVRNSQNSESWSCAWSCQADQSPTLILTRTSSGVRLANEYSGIVQSGWTRSSCLPACMIHQRRRWRRDTSARCGTIPHSRLYLVCHGRPWCSQRLWAGTWGTFFVGRFLHILRKNQQFAFTETTYFVFNSVFYGEPSQLPKKAFGMLCSTMQSY